MKIRVWACIFLMVLFFGCLSPVKQSAPDANLLAVQAKCGAINATNINETYPAATDKCFWGHSLVDCARDFCYIDYALATGDPSVCEAVVPAVTYAGATGANSIGKGNCYGGVIMKSNDTTICERISDTDGRNDCSFELALIYNYTFCDKISNLSKKDYCYDATMSKGVDLDICERISDPRIKDDCYAGYNEIATYTNNSDMCDKISNLSRKDGCYKSVANGNINPGICDKIGNPGVKDDCYYRVAIKSGNSSICDEISGSGGKDDCYYEYNKIAINSGNPDMCDKISNLSRKDDCYYDYDKIAIRDYNPDMCDKISNLSRKDGCYYDYDKIAIRDYNNPDMCDKISNLSRKDGCYYGIAIDSHNSSICDNIGDSSTKSDCLLWFK
jgi:hypothetical protein